MNYYLVFLGLFLVRKVADQLRSQRNMRAMEQKPMVAIQHDAFPILLLAHAAFFVLVPMELMLAARPFLPALGGPMIGLFVLASLLRWWSTRSLGESWTSRVVVPADLQPVTTGPYRWVRHPNYLAMSLELVALSLVYPTYLSACVVVLLCGVAIAVRIRREEDALFQIPAYRAAMQGKARLIPWIY